MSNAPIAVVIYDDHLDDRQLGDYGLPPQDIAPRLLKHRRLNHEYVNAHCPAPTCDAARRAMMSGVPPTESGFLTSSWRNTYASAKMPMPWIHRRFQEQGWRTESWGKVFHTSDRHEPPPDGFDFIEPPGAHARPHGKGAPSLHWGASRDDQPDEKLVDKLEPRLATLADREILFIGLASTHIPAAPPAAFVDMIDIDKIVIPETGPTPTGLASTMVSGKAILEEIVELDLQKQFIQHYLATVRFADTQLGRILDALPDGTRTVVTSDHGWALGERGRGIKKGQVWSQVTEVPLVIDSDLYPRGAQTHHQVTTTVLPTILEGFVSDTRLATRASDVAVVAFEHLSVQARGMYGSEFNLIHHYTKYESEYEMYYRTDHDQKFNVLVPPAAIAALAGWQR